MVSKRPLVECVIERGRSLRDALASLELSGSGVVVVLDSERVVGLLTDGDVRRALLAGVPLSAPAAAHMKTTFISVDATVSRVDVLDIMKAQSISEVPILDHDGQLVGLHRMHDVISPTTRDNWAVVMAGGRGTRLAPLTDTLPKPMLRVAGRPILERLVLHLVGCGIRRIFLSINYLGHVVEDYFGDGSHFGCRIEYLREKMPLGTAGALGLLPELPESPLLVMNGDLVTQTDFAALLAFHEAQSVAMTIGIRRYFHTVPFGCLELEGARVIGIEEKPTLSRTINAGIYAIAPSLLQLIPVGREYSMPALIDAAIQSPKQVVGYEIFEEWIDVGRKEQLNDARGEG